MKYLFCPLILLLLLAGCSGVSLIQKEDTSHLYRANFVQRVKAIKAMHNQGQKSQALSELGRMDDASLAAVEKALKYNLIGVFHFSASRLEKSLFAFDQALSTSGEDKGLTSQIYLNLASSYFQLEQMEESYSQLALVQAQRLSAKERSKYFKLLYLVASKVDRPDEALRALIEHLGSFETPSQLAQSGLLDDLISQFQGLSWNEKVRLFESFEERELSSIGHLAISESQKLFYAGDQEKAANLIEWVKDHFSKDSPTFKKAEDFEFRLSNYSKINPNAIGVVLPLTGKSKDLAKKAMVGLDFALGRLKKQGARPLVIYYRDSAGQAVKGAHAVKGLIENQNVALVIGGLNSAEAQRGYEEAKKHGVFFISLNSIFLSREQKNHLLLEIPGSVESQVSTLFSDQQLDQLGRRGAILYPESSKGQAFVDEFWEQAQEKGVDVAKVQSYPNTVNDYTGPVQNLLSLSYPREREEEYRLMKEIHELESKRGPRRLQTLTPEVDFDWIFVPSTPQKALQIVPSFDYFDATGVTFIGDSSWRSKVVSRLSLEQSRLNFIGDGLGQIEEDLKEEFKVKYGEYPGLIHILAYDALKLSSSLIRGGEFGSRNEFEEDLLENGLMLKGLSGQWSLDKDLWIKKLVVLKFKRGEILGPSERDPSSALKGDQSEQRPSEQGLQSESLINDVLEVDPELEEDQTILRSRRGDGDQVSLVRSSIARAV